MMNLLELKNFALLLIVASVGVACTQNIEDEGSGTVAVTLDLNAFTNTTRSYLSPDESRVADVNLFVYGDGGTLAASYFGTPESCTVQLTRGQAFDFYVLANYGSALTPPESSAGLAGLVLDFRPAGLKDACIPMAGSRKNCVLSAGVPVSITVQRLFAKVGIRVDESLLKTASFQYKSLKLKQCPTHIAPWKNDFYETAEVVDGDSASSKDIASISTEECYFYVPENRRKLNFSNDDPWKKVPSNIDCAALLPYVELSASYEDHGLSATRSDFRFYLGGNATDNFEIIRNKVYHITLYPTDEGVFKGSWKLETEDFTNNRSLAFDKSGFTLGYGRSVSVNLLVQPAGLEYELLYDEALWARNGVSLTKTGEKFTITSAYTGTSAMSLEMRAKDKKEYAEAVCSFNLSPMKSPELKVTGAPADAWGGVDYTLSCIYADALGVEKTVTPDSYSLTLTRGVPSDLLAYADGKLKAADWWGRSGAWTGTLPEYELTLSYQGVETTVSGRIHGHVGFEAPQTLSAYYRDVTTSSVLTPSDIFLTGSDRTDISGNMTTSSVKLNGSLIGGNSAVWKGPYLKMGTYELECRYVDPSNNKTRILALPVNVVSNVKSLSGIVGFRVLEDSNGGHGDYYAEFSVSHENNECDLGLSMLCGYEEVIHFQVKGDGLRYVDFKGGLHTVDQYDLWTGDDLYAGFNNFYIDEFTGEDSILLEINGFEFRLGYRVN